MFCEGPPPLPLILSFHSCLLNFDEPYRAYIGGVKFFSKTYFILHLAPRYAPSPCIFRDLGLKENNWSYNLHVRYIINNALEVCSC